MIDLDAMCTAANARLRKSIANSVGQHKRHMRKMAESMKPHPEVFRIYSDYKDASNWRRMEFAQRGLYQQPWTPESIKHFLATSDSYSDLRIYTPKW